MKHIAATLVLALLGISPLNAADPQPAPNAQPAKEPYSPGLGEIMSLQQMRHAKLWLAGQESNWELAAYELDELKEGFEDAAKLFPTHNNVPIAQMIEDITKTSVSDLDQAIGAKNAPKFAAAFDRVTASCNACHQAANHGFIVIRRPVGSPFPNQDFSVKTK